MSKAKKAKTVGCGECGHVCRDQGEFHPHLFCVLKKAGRLDPWSDFRWAVNRLGYELPLDPPLIRDLPLASTSTREAAGA